MTFLCDGIKLCTLGGLGAMAIGTAVVVIESKGILVLSYANST